MTQREMFGKAKWICADTGSASPLIRKNFIWNSKERTVLRILGLGTFVCFVNGKRVSDEYFMPLMSKFERTFMPKDEELFGFRAYVCEYDITKYLTEGKNTLSVMLGESDYTELRYDGIHRILGEKKVIFRLSVGNDEIVSDGSEKYVISFITRSGFHEGGEHNYVGWSGEAMLPSYDEGNDSAVKIAKELDGTQYCFTDCPPDKIIKELQAKVIYSCENYKLYDCGENTTGYPVVISREGCSGNVEIDFSEELIDNGRDIDPAHSYSQHLYATVDGRETAVYPYFSWFGFRYFRIKGDADCSTVKVIHADVKQSSSFKTNDETLNWIYDAYINTQFTNMHRGGPTDCPHLERSYYTGDGQLLCRTAMMTLSSREFYKKWIMDISDCQDKRSGRVQYTAPYYISCGGGPGGWGCAIVILPYEYYKAYGDDSLLKLLYSQMLDYLDFLESRSEANLVTSFKEGDWCLGDWAGPEKWMLPAPFVNTYFRVLSTMRVIEIARVIGREEDIPRLEADIKKCKTAINKFYFNDFIADDCYCANTQGAGAFAMNIGLGTKRTAEKFIDYYEKLGHYDTGIFGTELVTRALFLLDRADLAYKLLTASEPYGYGRWYKSGATTLREYFTEPSRSHSHPMFGSVVAAIFEYIVGIRQSENSAAYSEIIISPKSIKELHTVSGHITAPHGKIAVSYRKENEKSIYTVEIPKGTLAHIEIEGIEPHTVKEGIYSFTVNNEK